MSLDATQKQIFDVGHGKCCSDVFQNISNQINSENLDILDEQILTNTVKIFMFIEMLTNYVFKVFIC